jgi:hypothetical protein
MDSLRQQRKSENARPPSGRRGRTRSGLSRRPSPASSGAPPRDRTMSSLIMEFDDEMRACPPDFSTVRFARSTNGVVVLHHRKETRRTKVVHARCTVGAQAGLGKDSRSAEYSPKRNCVSPVRKRVLRLGKVNRRDAGERRVF